MSQFQKVAAVALSLSGIAMLAAGADRIFTTPNPAAELKRLFPGAAAFSALTGEPLSDEPSMPSRGALHVATHRLRRRCHELLREEVAAIVDNPIEDDDEARVLFAALGA